MKKRNQFLAALLAVAVLLAMSVAALAAPDDTGFSDVSADAWYADAVAYVRENNLMSGTGATTFSPDGVTSRAMLAAILYRAEGSPAAANSATFRDVAADAYYADAAGWAASGGIISGYGNGLFGSDDPVSREQLATILWRLAGSPKAEGGQAFADQDEISAYATDAVNWARTGGILSGVEGNRFAPKASATRAQVAAILQRYLTGTQSGGDTPDGKPDTTQGKTLVVYFSATGNTKAVAETIATTLGADRYEIVPETPYTAADLDWTTSTSRVNIEHEDPAFRPAIAGEKPDLSGYDAIFLGYPSWWGEAPNIVRTFLEENSLAGKTVVPFCTSSSSGLGSSVDTLRAIAPNANWQSGRRFPGGVASDEVRAWVEGLDLGAAAAPEQAARTLVVYFSVPETTNPDNMTTEEANSTVVVDGKVLGNTEYMAQVIQMATNADLFRIEPVTPYPTAHSTLVDLASQEQSDNARPAIRGRIENLDSYDTIFIGYPIWWSDMPMILYSFFDTYDLSGKTVIPFSTHGGSGFSGTPEAIGKLEPGAKLLDGLTISRSSIQTAEQEILRWVEGLGL